MHLNCALVSIFLFVSAVLAGYHPEKQQPPFLDRIEKSNNTTDLVTSTYWAGAVWQAQAQGIPVDFAAGTFTVPSATKVGSSSDSFEIGVGLNGYAPCSDFTLGVGIDVIVTGADSPTSYQAWGRWSRDMVKIPAVKEFSILTGNQIRAIVLMLDPTSGLVILINYKTNRVWAEFVTGRQTHCRQDAAWVISTLPDQPQLSFPNFGGVDFTGIGARISAKWQVPNAGAVNFKQQDGRDAVSNIVIMGADVIIMY